MNIGCVLLAAGLSKRFGGNKLGARINGETLIEHAVALHAETDYAIRVLVTRPENTVVLETVGNRFDAVAMNPNPERGISSSVKIGLERLCLEAARKGIFLDGVLFGVCDQPNLTKGTIQRLLETFARDPDYIVAPLRSDGKRGNPVLFPVGLLPDFMELQGDRGGGAVIDLYPEKLVTVPVDDLELFDIDTAGDAGIDSFRQQTDPAEK